MGYFMLLLSQFCTSRITQSSMSTQEPTGERLTTVIEVDRCSVPSSSIHTTPLHYSNCWLWLLRWCIRPLRYLHHHCDRPITQVTNTLPQCCCLEAALPCSRFRFPPKPLWKTIWWSSWTLDRAGLLVLSLRLVWYPGAPIQPQKPLFQQDGRWNEDDFHFLCIHLTTLKKNRCKKICHYSNPKQELRNGELHSVGK